MGDLMLTIIRAFSEMTWPGVFGFSVLWIGFVFLVMLAVMTFKETRK